MPTLNYTRENVPGSFFLLETAHDCRTNELVEDGTYGNGPYVSIFLGYVRISLAPKKYGLRYYEMN